MTIRTRTFLLGLIAILALVGAGCGGDQGGGGGGPEARALLERAFAKPTDSGDLSLEGKADLKGSASLNGEYSIAISGPIQARGKTELPLLDWDIAVEGQGQKLEGALVLAQDNAFVEFQGQSYELGTALYQQIAQSYAQQQQAAGAPQTLEDFGVDPASWLEERTVEDGEQIGGDATQLVSGSVDVEKLVRDGVELLENPAVRSQLESQGQAPEKPTDEEIGQVEEAIKDITLEANVDDEDNLRRLLIDLSFEAPEGSDTSDLESGTASIETTLESVGGEADIQEPADPAPISELLQRFGLGGTPALP